MDTGIHIGFELIACFASDSLTFRHCPMLRRGRRAFARDDSAAEKAHDKADKDAPAHPYRDNARVWQLYLEEAEKEAKERGASWRAGLDSLLIFSGLLVGTVATFVTDARKDVQTDSEQQLLGRIVSLLKTRRDIKADISTTSQRVHAIWIISLFLSMLSTIMGVLARSWMTKFLPVTTRFRATDAYNRYRLNQEAERWHLDAVLTTIPFFVQVASSLFLAGLIDQLSGENPTLSRILWVFGGVAVLLYSTITCMPLAVKFSPFDTPLSRALSWIHRTASRRHVRTIPKPASRGTPSMKQVLADILYTELIKSPNLSLLDEAIEEMAHPLFSDECLEPLCLDGKTTFDIVWKRFKDCATGLADVPTQQRDENIRNCLLALSSFVRIYETRFRRPDCNVQLNESSLRKAISVDSPLHRWNALAVDLRPLAFSVRAHISVLLTPSSESDFRKEELEEQPWGMALRDIRNGYRFRFVLGACRGLVQSQYLPNLRTVSSLTLCLSLAKAAVTSSSSALMTEWTGIHDGKDSAYAKRHVSCVMIKLYDVIVQGWEDMAGEALDAPRLANISADGIPRMLEIVANLLHGEPQECALKDHAIKLLKHIFSPQGGANRLWTAFLQERGIFQLLADVAVYNSVDAQVQTDALIALCHLAGTGEGAEAEVVQAVCGSLQYGLQNDLTIYRSLQFFLRLCTTRRTRILYPLLKDECLNQIRRWIGAILRVVVETGIAYSGLGWKGDQDEGCASGDDRYSCQVGGAVKIVSETDGVDEDVSEHGEERDDGEAQDRGDCGSGMGAGKNAAEEGWQDMIWDTLHKATDCLHVEEDAECACMVPRTRLKEAINQELGFRLRRQSSLGSGRRALLASMASDSTRYPEDFPKFARFWYDYDEFQAAYIEIVLSVIVDPSEQVMRTRAERLLRMLAAPGMASAKSLFEVKVVDKIAERSAALPGHPCAKILGEVRRNLIEENMSQLQIIIMNSTDWNTPDRREHLLTVRLYCLTNPHIHQVDTDSASLMSTVLGRGEQIVGEPVVPMRVLWACFLLDLINYGDPFLELIPLFIDTTVNCSKDDIADILKQLQCRENSGFGEAIVLVLIKKLSFALGDQSPPDLAMLMQMLELLLLLRDHDTLKRIVDEASGPILSAVNAVIAKLDSRPFSSISRLTLDSNAPWPPQEGNSEVDKAFLASISSSHPVTGMSSPHRMSWVETVYNLVVQFPGLLDNAPGHLVCVATCDPDHAVRMHCLELLRAVDREDIARDILGMLLEIPFERLIQAGDPRIQSSSIRLLSHLIRHSGRAPLHLQTVSELLKSAVGDRDPDVRVAALDFMSSVIVAEEGERGIEDLIEQRILEQNYEAATLSAVEACAWLRLHVAMTDRHSANFSHLKRLLDIIMRDDEAPICDAIDALHPLLRHAKSKYSTSSKLYTSIANALQSYDSIIRANAFRLLEGVTEPQQGPPADNSGDQPSRALDTATHSILLRIISLMSLHKAISVRNDAAKLIESAINESPDLESYTLQTLFESIAKPIQDVVSMLLESSLRPDLDCEYFQNALSLYHLLLQQPPEACSAIFGRSNDAKIISHLARVAIHDRDEGMRTGALSSLVLTLVYQRERFHELVKSCLTSVISTSFAEQNTSARENALDAIEYLRGAWLDPPFNVTERRKIIQVPYYINIILQRSYPHLLKAYLIPSFPPDSSFMSRVADILSQYVAKDRALRRDGFLSSIWRAIPPLIPLATREGKQLLLRLAKDSTPILGRESAEYIIRELGPILQHSTRQASIAAVELLSVFYRKHGNDHYSLRRPLIEYVVPELLFLALDGKEQANRTHAAIISLLTIAAEDGEVLEQLAPFAERFILLLKKDVLRSPVLELLSLLSTSRKVRQAILIWLIQWALGKECGLHPDGVSDLVVRLISDGRLEREPIDYVMMFLASGISTRAEFRQHRIFISTALWAYHRRGADFEASLHILSAWLSMALFGRHATDWEVTTWNGSCDNWIVDEQGSTSTGHWL